MTHRERATRRASMADMVRQGASLAEVARSEGVCTGLVRKACDEHGVTTVSRTVSVMRALEVVGQMVRRDGTLWALALEHDMEFSYLTKLYRKCVAVGIPVRHRKRGRPSGGSDD